MSSAEAQRPMRLVVLISGGGTTLKNLLAKIAAGKLAGELWRANIKYDVAGLLSAQGPHHASAIKAQNGVPGPRFLKVDLDLSKNPGTGVLWVDGDGTDKCRSEFQLASE